MKKTHLLTIDPQNDFCIADDGKGHKAALHVKGAEEDMQRLAAFVRKNRKRLADIHCSLDSHQLIHIAHPQFWTNSRGQSPPVFTEISEQDTRDSVWIPKNPSLSKYAIHYTSELSTHKRYKLMIWPPHCLVGTWGGALVEEVAAAFYEWEADFKKVDFVVKGNNFKTEHYSAVQADVPDDSDPTTKLNTGLIDVLREADEIIITGQALSHCVANTVTDIANSFGDDNITKFVLLTDTCSNVAGFETTGQKFVKDLCARGMKTTTTKDW